jgi:hypothetical protein
VVAYQVRVYNWLGEVVYVTDRFRSGTVEHRVNHVSNLQLAVAEQEGITAYLDEADEHLDYLVEVRRSAPEFGIDWYTEFIGFHRTAQRQITTADQRILTSYCRGLLDLIKRRSIRHYGDTEGSSKGPMPADDAIKQYVRENAGSEATEGGGPAPGRVTNGVTPGLDVTINASQAATYEGACAWDNLLEAMRAIGELHSVDFDVVWGGQENPLSWLFQTYWPRLGTDRTAGTDAPVVFSPMASNATNLSHTRSRTEEITSVLVLGPGEGPTRDTTLRTSLHMVDSPWNLIEGEVNASNEDRALALQQVGDDLLREKRPATSLTFEVLQTPGTAYRNHYFLGDLVSAQFSYSHDHIHNMKIRAVTLNIGEDSRETVSLTLETLD